MAHFAAVHKTTGEVLFTQNGPETLGDDWDVRPISRAPTVFDDYKDGRLAKNSEREAFVREEERLSRMTRAELQAEAVGKAEVAAVARLKRGGGGVA